LLIFFLQNSLDSLPSQLVKCLVSDSLFQNNLIWGQFGKVEGPFEKVKGQFEKFEGPFEKVEGQFEKVEGPFENVEGHF